MTQEAVPFQLQAHGAFPPGCWGKKRMINSGVSRRS